jgi:hypothetical protein
MGVMDNQEAESRLRVARKAVAELADCGDFDLTAYP